MFSHLNSKCPALCSVTSHQLNLYNRIIAFLSLRRNERICCNIKTLFQRTTYPIIISHRRRAGIFARFYETLYLKNQGSTIETNEPKIIRKIGCETAKSNRVLLQADDITNYIFTQYYVNLFVLNHQLTTHQKF